MSIKLKANNLDLLTNSKFSYLLNNYSSGGTTLVVINSEAINNNDFLIIGEIGNETTEIVQVESISGNTLTLKAVLKFAHAESTRVTVSPYNQTRFFWTSTSAFSASNPVTDYLDIEPDSLFTTADDITNTTGYGWFVFSILRLLGSSTTQFDITNPSGTTFRYTYDTTGADPDIDSYVAVGNSIVIAGQNFNAANNGSFTVTAVGTTYFEITNAAGVAEDNVTIGTGSISLRKVTQNSNYINYGGFAVNSAKKMIDYFMSQLSITEQKMLTTTEVLAFLAEAYSVARNELNLVNKEYNVEEAYDLATTSALAEYSLPDNFSSILSLWDNDNSGEIGYLEVRDVESYSNDSENETKFYLRGDYIGFAPTPTSEVNYKLRYLTKAGSLTSYTDTIDLPNNNFFILVNYMMFKASSRLKRNDGPAFYKLFFEDISRLKTSVKRNNEASSWGINNSAFI